MNQGATPDGDDAGAFAFACPSCRTRLVVVADVAQCESCGVTFSKLDGIWRFLPESRIATFAAFLQSYQVVRKAEGWGAADAGYYHNLPDVPANDPLRDIWRIRSRSFHALIDNVIGRLESKHSQPLKILDVGAGNGWLSFQLARRRHRIAAIDVSTDDRDGLGAITWYDRHAKTGGDAVIPIQAEFDRLPFVAGQAHVVIFNAALHYSTDYRATMSEALRLTRADGHLVVLDSPFYRDPTSGESMVRERAAAFQKNYGFSGPAIQTESFLTYSRLAALANSLDLQVRVIDPVPTWRSTLRAVKTRLRGQREPAGFPIVVMRRMAPSARSS